MRWFRWGYSIAWTWELWQKTMQYSQSILKRNPSGVHKFSLQTVQWCYLFTLACLPEDHLPYPKIISHSFLPGKVHRNVIEPSNTTQRKLYPLFKPGFNKWKWKCHYFLYFCHGSRTEEPLTCFRCFFPQNGTTQLSWKWKEEDWNKGGEVRRLVADLSNLSAVRWAEMSKCTTLIQLGSSRNEILLLLCHGTTT